MRTDLRRTLAQLATRFIEPASARFIFYAAAFWLCLLAGVRPLMLPDEGRYGGVAWEMVARGQLGVPLLDGMPFFHKPPLFYWLDAISLTVLGPSAWAARFASLVGALVAACALHRFLDRYYGGRMATLTAVILLSMPMFFAGAQFANLDMLVAGMISLTVLSGADAVFRHAKGEGWWLPLLRTFVFAGLGVLAKGLIGIVLPGGILFCWLMARRSWPSLRLLISPTGWMVFLLVALPWFAWMQYSYPGFFDYFVIHHHVQRFSQTGFNNQMPFWFYLPVVLLCTLPWSIWIFRRLGRNNWWGGEKGAVRGLMACWMAIIFVFFSLPSSKLVGYILPVLPPFAFFIGEYFEWRFASDRPGSRRAFFVSLGLSVSLCVALVVGLRLADKTSIRPLAEQMRPAWHPSEPIVTLDNYPYDLAFYLGGVPDFWVVSNWADPEVKTRDNWRKELFDAGLFEPERATRSLIDPAEMKRRICQSSSPVFWFLGNTGVTTEYPWLAHIPVYAETSKLRVWRIESPLAAATVNCAGMPKSD